MVVCVCVSALVVVTEVSTAHVPEPPAPTLPLGLAVLEEAADAFFVEVVVAAVRAGTNVWAARLRQLEYLELVSTAGTDEDEDGTEIELLAAAGR